MSILEQAMCVLALAQLTTFAMFGYFALSDLHTRVIAYAQFAIATLLSLAIVWLWIVNY